MTPPPLFKISKGVSSKKKNERYYQDKWCYLRGITEHRLYDGSRVDCETPSHSIEFDWSKKWAEAIGQSLYYSILTGKKAGIVLILKKPTHYTHWLKLNTVITERNLPITTWIIKTYD